jgi:hypothetical protein
VQNKKEKKNHQKISRQFFFLEETSIISGRVQLKNEKSEKFNKTKIQAGKNKKVSNFFFSKIIISFF